LTVPEIKITITGLPSPERLALCYCLHRALLDYRLPVQCSEDAVPHNYVNTVVTYRNSLVEMGGCIALATCDGEGEVRPRPPTPATAASAADQQARPAKPKE
jgi:hypothetical protein